jgi:tRNA threonylcarbamoyladenosine modification (KEOPS) complex  Pcc1 subunit
VIAVNGDAAVSINRQTSRIAIEVKTEEFAVLEGLYEAFLQLVRLPVAKEIIFSCAILTNLTKHTIYYIFNL